MHKAHDAVEGPPPISDELIDAAWRSDYFFFDQGASGTVIP